MGDSLVAVDIYAPGDMMKMIEDDKTQYWYYMNGMCYGRVYGEFSDILYPRIEPDVLYLVPEHGQDEIHRRIIEWNRQHSPFTSMLEF